MIRIANTRDALVRDSEDAPVAVNENARRGECLGNKHHGERANDNDCFVAAHDDTPSAPETEDEDERAKAKARAWRRGKAHVWSWWVDRLNERLASGGSYASMRSFTDDIGQNRDVVDERGRKVSVPHSKGLGRGIALLMVEEHPEFGKLLRTRGAK